MSHNLIDRSSLVHVILVAVRQQAFIWADVDLDNVSLRHSGLQSIYTLRCQSRNG